eukprot:170456_1
MCIALLLLDTQLSEEFLVPLPSLTVITKSTMTTMEPRDRMKRKLYKSISYSKAYRSQKNEAKAIMYPLIKYFIHAYDVDLNTIRSKYPDLMTKLMCIEKCIDKFVQWKPEEKECEQQIDHVQWKPEEKECEQQIDHGVTKQELEQAVMYDPMNVNHSIALWKWYVERGENPGT